MKILFISPFPPDKNGVGQYTNRLFKNLQMMDADVSVITFADKEDNKNTSVYPVFSSAPKGIKYTWQTLLNIKPEIIHVQFAIPAFRLNSLTLWLLLWYYKNQNKVRIVATLHEPKRDITYLGILGRLLYKAIYEICDEIYVLTDESRTFMIQKCHVPEIKIQVIPHGLHSFHKKDNHTKALREKIGLAHQNKIILFFGHIHIDKGIEYLIEAFSQFINNNKNPLYILIIAGGIHSRTGVFKVFQKIDEQYEHKLHKLVKKYKILDRVIFTGYVSNDDIYSMFQLAEVIVLPYSKAEQSGVLNMALTTNRPIIASSVGGFKDMLAETGILVPPRNSGAIADALKKILSPTNKDLKAALIDSYQKLALQHDIQLVTQKQLERYRKLINP